MVRNSICKVFSKKLLSLLLIVVFYSSIVFATDYPGTNPGVANLTIENNQYTLSNNVIEISFQLSENNLSVTSIMDKENGSSNYLQINELFKLVLNDNSEIYDTKMIAGSPTTQNLTGNPQSLRVRERENGKKVSIPFTYNSDGKTLSLTWSAILRDGSNYVNQEITFTATSGDWDIDRIQLIDITRAGVQIVGNQDGSPFFAGQFFFGQETPVAKCRVSGSNATAYFPRQYITYQGESFTQTSAIGVYPGNQRRRGFQYYLERERIREHYAFLHYNTWWDINGGSVNESNMLNRINTFGRELVTERGVDLKGFVIDDGYDDLVLSRASAIWEFVPSQFPNGITTLKNAAEAFGADIGLWMSPAGGYGGLAERVAIAKKMNPGIETHPDGTLKISGPIYYPIFKAAVFKKMDAGVTSFKFDRISGSEDVYAVARLSQEMREKNSQVFINATVGTWGSPYFLWFFDSVWRQGADAKGEADATRDQQVTYRDLESRNLTFSNPMMPLNSLMVHGIGQGVSYQGKSYSHDANGNPLDMNDAANLQDFREEVRNYFAQGFNLQELYITPSLMTEGCWDVLAEAANWGHANHDVLMDARFIGGNPANNQVYGVASWNKTKGILMIRNPSSSIKSISFTPEQAFELPTGYSKNFILIDPFDNTAIGLSFNTGSSRMFSVPAESILLFEAVTSEPIAPVAAFSGTPRSLTKGGSVTFTDQSSNFPTSWVWTFEGGTPSTSTSRNPTVVYNTAGTYQVTLKATNSYGDSSDTKSHYITVNNLSISDEISKSGWSIESFSSQQGGGYNNEATKLIDGDEATIWHTEFTPTTARYPHEVVIDMGASYDLSKIKCVPRNDGGVNGRIANYEIYVSASTSSWEAPVATGTWPNSSIAQEVSFTKTGRYIRLVAKSEVNGGPWASAAEIYAYGTPDLSLGLSPVIETEKGLSVNCYPNPTVGDVNIRINGKTKGDISIRVVDLSGLLLFQKEEYKNSDKFTTTINLGNLSSQVCVLQVISTTGRTQTKLLLDNKPKRGEGF